MPSTKNLLVRIATLDSLLSNRYHNYSLNDLTDKVNEKLSEIECPPVTRRTIEYDIDFLESAPFYVEIEKYRSDYYMSNGKITVKKCLRYKQNGYSIFNHTLSSDEKYVLTEALSYLGQFDGLPNFESLEALKIKYDDKPIKKIMLLEKNELDQTTHFAVLFTAISQQQVITLTYKAFNRTSATKYILHPYLLKEYNRRWYLLALSDDTHEIKVFALDRIVNIDICNKNYFVSDEDILEYFDDIVGVANYTEEEVLEILFWVSDKDVQYIRTRPIHASQIFFHSAKENKLRQLYPQLEGGAFFSINCKKNYELIQELTSYGSNLVVLSPQYIVDEVINYIDNMNEKYSFLRK